MDKYLKWLGLSFTSGVLAGSAAALFLFLLKIVTEFRNSNLIIIWLLPIAGLFIGWIYTKYGKEIVTGNNLIIDEVHDPKKIVPFRMAPFILFGTVITHLFGGSAGREGTAVQMGASLADQLTKFFKVSHEERKILLTTGTGAGFGAAIGAPVAGVIFGMEVLHVGKLKPFAIWQNVVASFTAYYTCLLLQAPHTLYPEVLLPQLTWQLPFYLILAGIAFGLAARGFVLFSHFVERLCKSYISTAMLRPFLAGLVLVALYSMEGSYQYAGLGLETIQNALVNQVGFQLPTLKAFFTGITVGSGFKGGEFIPLVFIGVTLGSALALILPVSFNLLAGMGFGAVFGAAANTPLACAIMVAEIFNWALLPHAILVCYFAYFVSGDKGIYQSQKIIKGKLVNRKLRNIIDSRGRQNLP